MELPLFVGYSSGITTIVFPSESEEPIIFEGTKRQHAELIQEKLTKITMEWLFKFRVIEPAKQAFYRVLKGETNTSILIEPEVTIDFCKGEKPHPGFSRVYMSLRTEKDVSGAEFLCRDDRSPSDLYAHEGKLVEYHTNKVLKGHSDEAELPTKERMHRAMESLQKFLKYRGVKKFTDNELIFEHLETVCKDYIAMKVCRDRRDFAITTVPACYEDADFAEGSALWNFMKLFLGGVNIWFSP